MAHWRVSGDAQMTERFYSHNDIKALAIMAQQDGREYVILGPFKHRIDSRYIMSLTAHERYSKFTFTSDAITVRNGKVWYYLSKSEFAKLYEVD